MEEQLATLRHILADGPCSGGFESILTLLAKTPKRNREPLQDYVRPHIEQWPFCERDTKGLKRSLQVIAYDLLPQDPPKGDTLLQQLNEAIDTQDVTKSFDLSLLGWKQTHHPAFAAIVEELDTKLPLVFDPQTIPEQDEWIAQAERRCVMHLGQLWLAVITKQNRVSNRRVKLLEPWCNDPRTASYIITAFHTPPYTSGHAQPFFRSLLRCAEQCTDPRLGEANLTDTHKLSYSLGSQLRTRFPSVFHKHAFRKADAITDATQKQLASLLATVQTWEQATTENATLWQAVWDAPHNSETQTQALQALALQLDKQRDPYGEFIQLQLLDKPTKHDKQRTKALYQEHHREWLGPLDAVVLANPTFKRGFLHQAKVFFKNQGQVQAYAHDPRWSTIETIDYSLTSTHHQPLFSTLHTNLKHIMNLRDVGAECLCESQDGPIWKIESIIGHRNSLPLMLESTRFPMLKSLFIRLYTFDYEPSLDTTLAITQAPWFPQLTNLALPIAGNEWTEWLNVIHQHPTLQECTFTLREPIPEAGESFPARTFQLTLTRRESTSFEATLQTQITPLYQRHARTLLNLAPKGMLQQATLVHKPKRNKGTPKTEPIKLKQ